MSNSTSGEAIQEQSSYKIGPVEAVYVCVGIFGFITNFASAAVFRRLRKTLSISSRLLLMHQSCVDCVWSVCLSVRMATPPLSFFTALSPDSVLHQLQCKLWMNNNIFWSLSVLSTYSLISLSIDLYLAVIKPQLFRAINKAGDESRQRIRFLSILLVSSWLVSVGYAVYPTMMYGVSDVGRCAVVEPEGAKLFSYVNISLKLFIPLISLTALYVHMLRHYTRHLNTIFSAGPPTGALPVPSSAATLSTAGPSASTYHLPTSPPSTAPTQQVINKGDAQYKFRQVQMSFFVLCCCRAGLYLLCFAPNQFFYFFIITKVIPGSLMESWVLILTIVLLYLYCCLNPIIYFATLKQFRHTLRDMMRECKHSCSRCSDASAFAINPNN